MTGDRIRALEGLRALAALAVFGLHAGTVSGLTTRSDLGVFVARLDVGVPVFFVLSGYLLYRPHVRAALDGTDPPAPGPYLRRRLARIVPAYWVALAVIPVALGTVVIDSMTDVVLFGGFAQIYDRTRVFGGIVPAWSLCTEMSFYLALPLLAVGVRRHGGRGPAPHLWLVAGAVVTSVAWRVWLRVGDPPFADLGSIWLPGTIDLFALGILVAVIDVGGTRHPVLGRVRDRCTRWAWAAWPAAVAVFGGAAVGLDLPRDLSATSMARDLLGQTAHGAVGLLVVAGAVFADGDSRGRRILASAPLVAAGTVSYGFFLWHLDVLERTAEWMGPGPTVSAVALVAVGLPLAGAAGTVSWFAVERPVLRAVRRRRPVSDAAAVPAGTARPTS